MVRWLHISDLHIKKKADWDNFRNELRNHCEKIGKINLVIVTGDFHDFEDKSDFDHSKKFLSKLVTDLSLDIKRDLFVVPGNHDGTTKVEGKNTYVAAAKGSPVNLEKIWIKKLLGAFEDYENFVKELISNYPGFPAQVHHRIWNNKINLIHCNTALVADGKRKEKQVLDIDSMASVEYRPDIPNIILAHNSFFDLNSEQQKRIKDIIRIYPVCAYLCGDRHRGDVDQITYETNQNRQIPCIVSYKSSPEATDDYSVFGVIIGEWEESEKTAYLKGWTWKSGDGFAIDGRITGQEIDMTRKLADHPDQFKVAEESTKAGEDKNCPNNQIKESQKDEMSAKLKRKFIKIYYNMTPAQIDTFNRKYNASGMRLKKKMKPKELYIHITEAEQKGLLDGMVCYMTDLFK